MIDTTAVGKKIQYCWDAAGMGWDGHGNASELECHGMEWDGMGENSRIEEYWTIPMIVRFTHKNYAKPRFFNDQH